MCPRVMRDWKITATSARAGYLVESSVAIAKKSVEGEDFTGEVGSGGDLHDACRFLARGVAAAGHRPSSEHWVMAPRTAGWGERHTVVLDRS